MTETLMTIQNSFLMQSFMGYLGTVEIYTQLLTIFLAYKTANPVYLPTARHENQYEDIENHTSFLSKDE